MLAFLIGAALGVVFAVLGAGGGIVAIPILLLVFKTSMQTATGAALAVVCAAALSGAIAHARARRVDLRVAFTFGGPSMVGAALGGRVHGLVPERITMAAFSLVLLLALGGLLLPRRDSAAAPRLHVLLVVGVLTGVLTGFLGVGGGFLVVPALTLFAGLPLHRAIGTSMAVIAVASFSGALVHVLSGHVPVELALPMGAGAIVGAFAGAPLAGRLPERPLRLGFVVVSLAVSAGMLLKALRVL